MKRHVNFLFHIHVRVREKGEVVIRMEIINKK
jgi:hypothetical protein